MNNQIQISENAIRKYDLPFFSSLANSTLACIDNVAIYRSYLPGKYIIIEGDQCQSAFLLLKGSVNVFRTSYSGRKYVLSRLCAGDWFNAICCWRSLKNNPASVLALSPVNVLAFRERDFHELIKKHHQFAINIMDNICERVAMYENQIEDLALRSISGRIANFILEHADEQGIIHWQCTQKDIADRLGSVSDVVGRVLRKFIDDGIIEMPTKNCIAIINTEDLIQETYK